MVEVHELLLGFKNIEVIRALKNINTEVGSLKGAQLCLLGDVRIEELVPSVRKLRAGGDNIVGKRSNQSMKSNFLSWST
ncbi:hypothetical protein D3C85_1829320 [compost metagenome]